MGSTHQIASGGKQASGFEIYGYSYQCLSIKVQLSVFISELLDYVARITLKMLACKSQLAGIGLLLVLTIKYGVLVYKYQIRDIMLQILGC